MFIKDLFKVLTSLMSLLTGMAKTSPVLLVIIPVLLLSDDSIGIISIVVVLWVVLGGNMSKIEKVVEKLGEGVDEACSLTPDSEEEKKPTKKKA